MEKLELEVGRRAPRGLFGYCYYLARQKDFVARSAREEQVVKHVVVAFVEERH